MSDVFLGYSSQDRSTAELLVNELERHGWSLWWDRRIRGGERFDASIEKELSNAGCIVILWSRTSVESDFVREEADWGRRRDNLVPVLIHRVKPPFGFGRIQALDLVGWRGERSHPGLNAVVTAIAGVIGKSVTPRLAPRTAAPAAPGRDWGVRLALWNWREARFLVRLSLEEHVVELRLRPGHYLVLVDGRQVKRSNWKTIDVDLSDGPVNRVFTMRPNPKRPSKSASNEELFADPTLFAQYMIVSVDGRVLIGEDQGELRAGPLSSPI